MTHGLEGRCSIQLSYGRQGASRDVGTDERTKTDRVEANQKGRRESGRSDLNRGPPAPKAGALTGLRYAPLIPSGAKKVSNHANLGQPDVTHEITLASARNARAR
jgi:hypothetical protein